MNRPPFASYIRSTTSALILTLILASSAIPISAQSTSPTAPPAGMPVQSATAADPAIAKIREEGLNHSQVMQTLSYLTDVIGPRLTGSPNLKRANEWTRDQMASYGMDNAHLESWNWGGRGWAVKHFHIEITAPQQIAIIAYPRAWSPGLEKPVATDLIWLDARTEADLQKYQGKLKGAIVLFGPPRTVNPEFSAPAFRLTDQDLARFANARPGATMDTQPTPPPRTPSTATSGPAGPGAGRGRGPQGLARGRIIAFLLQEGALMELSPSPEFEAGNMTGQSATIPTNTPPATAGGGRPGGGVGPGGPGGGGGGGGGRGGPSSYSLNPPPTLPQIILAVEHYNRLVRMAQQNIPMKIDVDLQTQYYTDDTNCYNTIAEIPGTDLKDEVVMIGGHLDSWHMGTGATDNGTGVAVSMEAARIITALKLQPRRTIRVALWTGEELGMLGSRAYARQHYGTAAGRNLLPGPPAPPGSQPATEPASQPAHTPEFEKFSVYLNTDEGGGRFRGIFLGNNESAAILFRQWLQPLADLGCSTVSLARASSTDHTSFESLGLPAYHFLPDPMDYWSRTWHTSQDLYDRVVPEDMRISSVIMATVAYDAAMADQKIPRRPGN